MINIQNESKISFQEKVRNKMVICIGAGEELLKIINENEIIKNRILFVADNKKKGQKILIDGKTQQVIGVDDIVIKPDCIILITTILYADQIIKQLDSLEKFDNVDVYVPYFFKSNEENAFCKIDWPTEIKIPKIIHYCWFGGSKIPDKFAQNIETWKKYCPDYKIVRWDESNYDYKKIKYMSEAYANNKWGFVPDYARLDIINTYGGIYLDTDVEIIKSFDSLLGFDLFCGFESKDYVAFGLGFGGISNNKILQEMMKQYEAESFICADGSLNLKPSPHYQTEILKKHGLVPDGTFQNVDGCAVFPKEYFSPVDFYGVTNVTEDTFSIHQYAATWLDENNLKKRERKSESIKYVMSRINA